ncbi:cell division protein FtsL [Desmospora profundinema]|uniref:Cell division protein FtsL n=1 Tax=Desmospora profundinema TaxID=1571184 RepID=A0ABU1IK90_9BACL|nr:cell division protein FtsL [Desmospora profundinema]MDR6224808.1 cell division protein FtsL [Desmospora profundinema]
MRDFRGNTSVAHQLEQPQVPRTEKQLQKQGLPTVEKWLYLTSVIVCVVIASLVLSRHAMLTEINMEVQQLEREAAELTESNRQLTTEKVDLGSGERIRQFAEERGMTLIREKRSPSSGSGSLPVRDDDRG